MILEGIKKIKYCAYDYEKVARQNGLIEFTPGRFILPDCNLFFEYAGETEYDFTDGDFIARGIIPIDLAMEMYETYKDILWSPFDNNLLGGVKNPESIAEHPNIYNCIESGKSVEENRKELLENDYDNCYITFSRIRTPEVLEWFVKIVKAYYSRKYENTRVLK